eukprot:TRINITY_DN759_c0_g1_i1.p1 TRINITY_DN759_c0_g1~~TRINITY_DN759_c0_g1_i1.p1  ORF type:complete len:138 (-),score=31.69 TRINITY_DN759_c0_g1_i1:248-661(-)
MSPIGLYFYSTLTLSSLDKFVKLLADRPHSKKNDIFISRSCSFTAQYRRAIELLEEESFIEIHGLGASMERTIRLAKLIQKNKKIKIGNSIGDLLLSPTTSTVILVDEYHPLSDNLLPTAKERSNSAIHIKIMKPKS